MFKPCGNILTDHSKAMFLLWILFVICVCLCHTVWSVQCSVVQVWYWIVSIFDLCTLTYFVVTCWKSADTLALWYGLLSCVLFTFQYGVLSQVKYLAISIPDLFLPYFAIDDFDTFLLGGRTGCLFF